MRILLVGLLFVCQPRTPEIHYLELDCFEAQVPVVDRDCRGLSCLTYSVGPSIPFLEWDIGNAHPISVAPGFGLQLSLSLEQVQLAIGGKAWDMLSVDLMVFGSLITNQDGQQMGVMPGQEGWFMLLSFSFNIALAPQTPPLGIAQGAAGLERANTIYLGRER